MTKTDLAELKDKLCEFDEIEIHEQFNNYDKECDFEGSEVDFTEGARNENAKSAAIITELLEIIQSQSEALTDIDSWLKRMSDLKWGDESYAPRFKKSVKNNSNLLSETNTRLQKLSEELND